MAGKGCSCGDVNAAAGCGGCSDAGDSYWCESCRKPVPEKRCPYCGLKARKGGPPDKGK